MELEVGDQALDDFLTFGQAGFIPTLPRPRGLRNIGKPVKYLQRTDRKMLVVGENNDIVTCRRSDFHPYNRTMDSVTTT